MSSNKIIYLTFESFFYIWLALFITLLIVLIFLIIKYYRIKKKIREKIFYKREIKNKNIDEKVKEFDEVIKVFEENFKQGLLNQAIIDSYSKLRNIITNHFNIFVAEHLTEKEAVEEVYSKHSSLIAFSSTFNNIYKIYEKARFGKENISSEECYNYLSYLKDLVNFLKSKYVSD